MAFKMKGPTFFKSALKNIIRGLGPHNPAHEAVGDNSDTAHSRPDFADKPKPPPPSPWDDIEEEEVEVKEEIKKDE